MKVLLVCVGYVHVFVDFGDSDYLFGFGGAVMQSRDPSTNVVLLEDAAAVLGVIMAASCMGLTSLTGTHTHTHTHPSVQHRETDDKK